MGIDYFQERAKSLQWIGQLVIETRALLKADRACFYRCSNGFAYILNDAAKNHDIKIYSLANKTRNRGVSNLPENLRKRHLDWYLQFAEIELLKSYFTKDLPIDSPLRNELVKLDIESYLVIKILSPDKMELYGFLLLTWNDHKDMPSLPEYSQKFREYLESVANAIYSEVQFLIRNPYTEYLESTTKKILKKVRILK